MKSLVPSVPSRLALPLVLALALCSCRSGRDDSWDAKTALKVTAQVGLELLAGPEPEPEPEPDGGLLGALLDCLLD